jgi:hypothetical protein
LFTESKKCISVEDAAIAGCVEMNFNKARVPHFFTPIIIACGSVLEFFIDKTPDQHDDVVKIQIIVIKKIIPLFRYT